MRPYPQHPLPWPGKLIRVAMALCLCLLPQGWAAEAVVDASLTAARAGFQPAVARAWELARAGWFDGALAVINEARRYTTDTGEMVKLDAMVVTYTMLRERAAADVSLRPSPQPSDITYTMLREDARADVSLRPSPQPSDIRPAAPRPALSNSPPPPRRRGWRRWLGRGKSAAAPADLAPAELTAAGTPAADAAAPAPASGTSRLNPMTWGRPTKAKPGTWEYSIGPALHGGGTVDFNRQQLRRPDGGRYVNGRHAGAADFLIQGDMADTAGERVSPQLDLIGWQTVDPNGVPRSGDETHFRNVTFDQSTFSGDSTDLDTNWAFSAGASRTLGRNPLRASRLTLDLGLFNSEADVSATQGNGITTRTLTGILYKEGGTVPTNSQPITPYQQQGGSVTPASEAALNLSMTEELFDLGGARTTATNVDLHADAYVGTLSLGLRYDVAATDWLTLFLGAGPAVHLALLRTSLAQKAVWDAPANPLDGQDVANFAAEHNDSDFALCGGVFVSLGTQVQLTQGLALALSLRLDEVFGRAKTDQADLDFGGFGGDVRLVFTF